MELAYIPSPSRGVVHLGPIPLRGYALCIILGVFVAVWLANRRWVARGGQPGTVGDIAVWAVLFGLIGGRLYHVVTTYEPYFGEHGHPVDALKIWQGGLGIWGAIALGAVGAWIGCRRRRVPLPAYADAAAPGIVLAQALGRWGNWFNQELYGKPSDLPWALKIDVDKRPTSSLDVATYHPTFLYESLWCVGVALLVLWVDRRFRLGHGRAFALYVAAYTVGRFWTEYLRIDEAHHILGLRLNDWTSIVVFAGAVVYFVVSARKRPGQERVVETARAGAAAPGSAEASLEAAPAEDDGTRADGAASGKPGADGKPEAVETTGAAGASGVAGASGAAGSAEDAGASEKAEATEEAKGAEKTGAPAVAAGKNGAGPKAAPAQDRTGPADKAVPLEKPASSGKAGSADKSASDKGGAGAPEGGDASAETPDDGAAKAGAGASADNSAGAGSAGSSS